MTQRAVSKVVSTSSEVQKPLRVVIVVTYAHPYVGSGLGVVAKFQAEYLAAMGHEVTLVSSNIPHTAPMSMLNGVTYVKVPALALLERFHIPVPILFFNWRVVHAIKHAHVVHIHDILYPSSFGAALIAKFYKKRVVLTQHVPHVEYPSKLVNLIEKAVFSTMGKATLLASDAVVVLNAIVNTWMKHYKQEVHLLPNGVDHRLFNKVSTREKLAIRKKFDLPPDKFIVLFVGRFVPKKGFDTLYNAQDSSYLLAFAGGGIVPEHIKSNHNVRIFGPLDQQELALLYKASDVFILPSHGEGFPLSIQEAMASGLPIVTSEQNRFDSSFDSPFISYIEPTVANIKAEIQRIQNDTSLQAQMSNTSLEIAHEHFSWEKNVSYLLQLYRGQHIPKNTSKDIAVSVLESAQKA